MFVSHASPHRRTRCPGAQAPGAGPAAPLSPEPSLPEGPLPPKHSGALRLERKSSDARWPGSGTPGTTIPSPLSAGTRRSKPRGHLNCKRAFGWVWAFVLTDTILRKKRSQTRARALLGCWHGTMAKSAGCCKHSTHDMLARPTSICATSRAKACLSQDL